MQSRKPVRSSKMSRKPLARPAPRKAMARTTDDRPKRKIGRKILLLLILIGIGHFGWKQITAERNGSESAVADSVKVEPAKSDASTKSEAKGKTEKAEAQSDSSVSETKTNPVTSLLAKVDSEKWFGWAEEWVDKVFVVRDVQMTGALSVPRDSLLALTDTLIGQPVFDLQLFDIAHQISAHPRVHRAKISRRLPSTVLIVVEERREEMLVVTKDGLYGVDAQHIVLPSPPPGWPLDVPVVTGFRGTLRIGETITDPKLIEAAEWVRRAKRNPRVHGWMSEVRIGLLGVESVGGINGWKVEPGKHAVVAQVAALDAYLEQHEDKRTQVENARYLDLRFPGFLIVKHGI